MVQSKTDRSGSRDQPDDLLERLGQGELEVRGRLVEASNATLYCTTTWRGQSSVCVYKPVAGERPLWDFPTGTLSHREVAAYLVSELLGWQIVPPTVWRDGPYGPGMVQHWIDVDESVDLVDLVRSDRAELQRMAVFDVVINNADRKGGHLLPTESGEVFGIDHGVCFSDETKVRTLLWQWEGEPIPVPITDDLKHLLRQLADEPVRRRLLVHLSVAELAATSRRIEALLTEPTHPGPSPDWPAIPWPPF